MNKGLTLTITVEGATPEQLAGIMNIVSATKIDPSVESAVDKLKVARQFLKLVRLVPSQNMIIEEMISGNGVLSKENMVAAHNGKGGSSLAGCLASITKNWQKSGGDGRFFSAGYLGPDGNGEWVYSIDREFLDALKQARVEIGKVTLRVP